MIYKREGKENNTQNKQNPSPKCKEAKHAFLSQHQLADKLRMFWEQSLHESLQQRLLCKEIVGTPGHFMDFEVSQIPFTSSGDGQGFSESLPVK